MRGAIQEPEARVEGSRAGDLTPWTWERRLWRGGGGGQMEGGGREEAMDLGERRGEGGVQKAN